MQADTPVERYVASSPLESITNLFPSRRSDKPEPSTSSTSTSPISRLTSTITASPIAVAVISGAGSVVIAFGGYRFYRRYWYRIRNSDYVTTGMLERKKWVKGVVTSVGDGDNFRLYHTPGIFFHFPFKLRTIPTAPKELKDETISIRIAGVDAPEAAHFGRPAQPHSQESLDWLRARLLTPERKTVVCQLVRKDQYNRIVAVPYIKRLILPNQPLPLEMLRTGMAVVYESAGGEYGDWGKEKLKEIEATAKSARIGIWAQSASTFESPAEYKRRHKVGDTADAEKDKGVLQSVAEKTGSGLWGWVRGWWRRS